VAWQRFRLAIWTDAGGLGGTGGSRGGDGGVGRGDGGGNGGLGELGGPGGGPGGGGGGLGRGRGGGPGGLGGSGGLAGSGTATTTTLDVRATCMGTHVPATDGIGFVETQLTKSRTVDSCEVYVHDTTVAYGKGAHGVASTKENATDSTVARMLFVPVVRSEQRRSAPVCGTLNVRSS